MADDGGATELFSEPRRALEAYLRSQGDNQKAEAMMKEGAAWRALFRPDLIRVADVQQTLERYQLYWHGIGSNGYRIAWLDNFKTHVPIQDAPQQDTHDLVLAIAYIAETSVSQTSPKVNVAINCSGISRKQLDERLARLFIEAEALAYPDALGWLLVFGLPTIVSVVLSALSPLLPRYWRERVTFSTADARRALSRVAGPGQLPVRHGGTCSDDAFSVSAFISERLRIESMPAEPRTDVGLPPFVYVDNLPWPAERVPETVASGWAKKRGGIVTHWKEYFFVLCPPRLLWFKMPQDRMPQGGIDCHKITAVRRASPADDGTVKSSNRSRCLAIETAVRTYFLVFKTQQDRDHWLGLVFGSLPV